jgi:hypothetical protein
MTARARVLRVRLGDSCGGAGGDGGKGGSEDGGDDGGRVARHRYRICMPMYRWRFSLSSSRGRRGAREQGELI